MVAQNSQKQWCPFTCSGISGPASQNPIMSKQNVVKWVGLSFCLRANMKGEHCSCILRNGRSGLVGFPDEQIKSEKGRWKSVSLAASRCECVQTSCVTSDRSALLGMLPSKAIRADLRWHYAAFFSFGESRMVVTKNNKMAYLDGKKNYKQTSNAIQWIFFFFLHFCFV